MKRLNMASTKKGAASLYVVIFTTILFSVITLSFIRIILSESVQSSNDDLSQSAYDSALAGVEDAKIAVNKYYQCLSNPSLSGCDVYKTGAGSAVNPDSIFRGHREDFKLKNDILYPTSTDSEVKVQESNLSGNNTDQAYTCVIVNNIVPDYRSTLTSDTRTKVIPLGVASDKLDDVKRVEFRWYSEINGTVFNSYFKDASSSNELPKKNESPVPPIVSLTLLRTDKSINIDSYNTAEGTDYSTMILRPVTSGGTNTISPTKIMEAGNAAVDNSLFMINCDHSEFACTVNLGNGSDALFYDGGNAFLIVSLPYGETITDFAVTMYDSSDNIVNFENVQISVDATGRANQLLRRVETRLDPSDTFFPYPEYEVTLGGAGDDSFLKNFWITNNCWTENGACPNNGSLN